MADEKLTARTESVDSSTSLEVHVVQGGVSYRQSRDNLLKPVQDQIDALPTWHDITGQSLSAATTTNIDTSQSTIEPTAIRIINPTGSLDNEDITKDFNIGHTQSGNWFIQVYSSVVRTGLTVSWYGVLLFLFLFGNINSQSLETGLGWSNPGKTNFLDTVQVQGANDNSIAFFYNKQLKTNTGFTYIPGTGLSIAEDITITGLNTNYALVYSNSDKLTTTSILTTGSILYRNGSTYPYLDWGPTNPGYYFFGSQNTGIRGTDGDSAILIGNGIDNAYLTGDGLKIVTPSFINDTNIFDWVEFHGGGVGASLNTEFLFNNAGLIDGAPLTTDGTDLFLGGGLNTDGNLITISSGDSIYFSTSKQQHINRAGGTGALEIEGASYGIDLNGYRVNISEKLIVNDDVDLNDTLNVNGKSYFNDDLNLSNETANSILYLDASKNTTTSSNLSWNDSLTLYSGLTKLNPNIISGVQSSAYMLNTANNIVSSSTRLLSVQNNDVDKFYIDKDGKVNGYNYTATNTVSGNLFAGTLPASSGANGLVVSGYAASGNKTGSYIYLNDIINHGTYDLGGYWLNIIDNPTTSGAKTRILLNNSIEGTDRTILYPRVADGATAVAYLFDTKNSLSTSGAKLLSVKNAGTEKLSVDKDGKTIISDDLTYAIRHAYLDFMDVTQAINVTQNVYSLITNATNNLYTSIDPSNVTVQGDTITIVTAGDYIINTSFGIQNASVGDVYDIGIFKNGVRQFHMPLKFPTANDSKIHTMFYYFEGLVAGDDISIRVTNTVDNDDPTFTTGAVYLRKEHD